ncbi:MAG TPA: prolyl oligopeptidase family serine peptidase [Jiangellaceae bacterium]
MSKRTRVVAVAAVLVLICAAGAVAAYQLWWAVDDPASAQCSEPPVSLGSERSASDHRELDLTFTCEDVALSGTAYLPDGQGPFPAVVWVHGAGPAERLRWGGEVLPGLVRAGVAVLSFDKRGAGASEGECCPGDEGYFNLLTSDVEGAVAVLRGLPDVDADHVGLVGASQAGWIVPRAAIEADAAFVALASAPTVPERTANLYERLAHGEEGELSRDEIASRLQDAGSDGFDPLPDLQHMTMPGLWLFGSADDVTPVEESVEVLDHLKADGHDVTVEVFPDAGHGLLDVPPAASDAPPTLIAWVSNHVR